MSHLHIPDGILPLWILLLGWLITSALLLLCVKKVKKDEIAMKLPYIGIVSAIMILAMMIEIVPIAYHFNLSVVAGIILGPSLAFISVFIVDMIIAMFGHGGITVVGLNTLVIALEAVAGFYIFRILLKIIRNQNSPGLSASIATICSLVLSTVLMIFFVSVINLTEPGMSDTNVMHDHELNHPEHKEGDADSVDLINVHRFTKTVVFMSFIGWLLEASMSGLIIRYIYRISPRIIWKPSS